MTLTELNTLSTDALLPKLMDCCASKNWAAQLARLRPFNSLADLTLKARQVWSTMTESDFLEAFHGHSKIGDLTSLKKKYAGTLEWSKQEQSGVNVGEAVLVELAEMNTAYENKFGFIFIVFATGKSAEEMLALLHGRIKNDRMTELQNAAAEQQKITELRLQKLLITD